MLVMPEGIVLQCRNEKKGVGYHHECLSPSFQIYEDGLLACCSCGQTYTFDSLKLINADRRNQ